ncbi:MAG: hypothetical protein JWL76_1793 [Thermoleophilia bacterium]|nr:hypothetical protein [Thermoleophilia bacterium]
MTSPRVDGAYPHRTGAAGASSTGSSPRIGADAKARSNQLAQQFAAQIEMSMMKSLSEMGASDESDESGDGGEDGGGSSDLGLDPGMQQMLLMTSLFAGAAKGGGSAAEVQARLAAFGGGGAGGMGALTGAGAGSEAQLAQQLLGTLGAAGTEGAAPGAAATPFSGAVDRGAAANAQIVAQVAREKGVDPVAAVAMMLVESGGRSTASGDGGTSFGLFQLHEGGMLTAAGLTKEQAFDPRTNASVSLSSLRHEWDKGHASRTPGQIAAASQRPADPVGYAAKVDGAMDRARALLGGG